MMVRLLALGLVWVAAAGAAAPLPLMPPPPDLTRLVPFVSAALDKPKIDVPDVAAPPPPGDLPALPPAPAVVSAERPVAYLTPSRGFPDPCWMKLVSANQSLECGKDKFIKGEYEEAVSALESAVRGGSDRDVVSQARYWLGESLVRLRRIEQADWVFRQVVPAAGQSAQNEYQVWATHASGWTALRLGDFTRARDTFGRLIGTTPASIDGWNRHGLGIALYQLGSYAEAKPVWDDAIRRGVPSALARDVAFWHGEALGRVGDFARAEAKLGTFTQGGPHPLLETGVLRLGWWTFSAGKFPESIAVFKRYLGTARRTTPPNPELDWAETGLALAAASTGDWEGALGQSREVALRKSEVAMPLYLRLVKAAVDAKKTPAADAIIQYLLAQPITPGVRAWLLIAKGDAGRAAGNTDDARTQYELAQNVEPNGELAAHAAFRLAKVNFELREFAQAVADAAKLRGARVPTDLRGPALLLEAEAAYHGGNYPVAATAYRRALVELPRHPHTPEIQLALAWVLLRQDQRDEARTLFREFAQRRPDHPSVADALVLGAELALKGGDLEVARRELDRVISGHPMHPRTDFARLNRAILMVRAGQIAEAQPALRDWITRAPFPPLIGRAHATLGTAFLVAQAPAEAAKHFGAAQKEGVGAFASLGLGAVAMAEGRWLEAERAFTEARAEGTAEITATADYGLAAVGFQRGAVKDFKRPAREMLRAAPSGPAAPRLLYVLTGIAADEKDWPAALDTAKTLVKQFPDDDAADDALERIGSGAAKTKTWPVVYEAYSLLRQSYPASPFIPGARIALAEALLATGRPDEARRDLEQFVPGTTGDAQAWFLLARAREVTGERQGALEAYSRAAREGKGPEFMRDASLGQARLLVLDKRWDQARAVLDRLLKSDDQALVLEAAYAIGETFRGEGDHLAAAEYYMSAAYLAPESEHGRRGLLGAAQSFAALKQPAAAAKLYQRLLAQGNIPAALADAARQGLQALGRREGS